MAKWLQYESTSQDPKVNCAEAAAFGFKVGDVVRLAESGYRGTKGARGVIISVENIEDGRLEVKWDFSDGRDFSDVRELGCIFANEVQVLQQ